MEHLMEQHNESFTSPKLRKFVALYCVKEMNVTVPELEGADGEAAGG